MFIQSFQLNEKFLITSKIFHVSIFIITIIKNTYFGSYESWKWSYTKIKVTMVKEIICPSIFLTTDTESK